MKNYFIFSVLISALIFSTGLKAQETNPNIQQGSYIYVELGEIGIPSFFTRTYEYIKPLNKFGFLSMRIN
jgi:hypothetical protein